MPHINRIRVNNVKYNFGTQFYDDFMMRFSCKNTIYDLANGGGKSVLMLLLLQNLIPNCTLDEKQPVEKLFRTTGGSNTIHSLIEWKLDSCYQRDNFKYMMTGFCARKGKDTGEDALRESANIEYFNYCIFYREFGDNDIRNLPLAKDGERITYNGLKSYLRDLEKRDRGVEVHIFERKGDYQNFIGRYGLFESEWEIIRGINKTEGHVRAYFENNYRTGRKVVEDLLIEEIIQKSFHNQIGSSFEDEGMAKTLLDIKDRIIELSRKKEEISVFDRQIELMGELSENIRSFKTYQEGKEQLKNQLLNKFAICTKLSDVFSEKMLQNAKKKEEAENAYEEEDKQILIAKVLDDRRELLQLKTLAQEFADKISRLVCEESEVGKRILFAECVDAYDEMKRYQDLKQEVQLSMDNSRRGSSDVYGEIYQLAAKAHLLLGDKKRMLQEQLKEYVSAREKLEEEYMRVKNGKEEAQIRAGVLESRIDGCKEELLHKEEELKNLAQEAGILVVENVGEDIEQLQETIAVNEEEILKNQNILEEMSARRKMLEKRGLQLEVEQRVLSHDLESFRKNQNDSDTNMDKVNSLAAVYGETDLKKLTTVIYNIYKSTVSQGAEVDVKIHAMKEYMTNLSEGRYVLDGEQYRQVEQYLFETYGEDVLYGYNWYATLSPAQQRDVARRVPFLDYSFVVKGDFERIRADRNLQKFTHCSYIVPIISETILRDTRHSTSVDYMVFGTKDLSFLMNPELVQAEILHAQDELEGLEENYRNLKRKQEVLWNDYLYMLECTGERGESMMEEIGRLEIERESLKQESLASGKELDTLKKAFAETEAAMKEKRQRSAALRERLWKLEKIKKINESLKLQYQNQKEMMEACSRARNLGVQYGISIQKCNESLREQKEKAERTTALLEKIKLQWHDVFEPYYKENVTASLEDISYEELLVRFNGLVSALYGRNVDVTDKKTLIQAYDEAISKALREIQKRGFTVDELARKTDTEGENSVRLQERLSEIRETLCGLRQENEAQNAQLNRMEGSLSHAVGAIEEKYGEVVFFDCENTAKFISEHTAAKKALRENISGYDKEEKKINRYLTDVSMIQRDIERMLQSAGVVVPANITTQEAVTEESLKDYEIIQKAYEKLVRNEYKKREEFLKEKRRITDSLKECSAFELAEEIERSVDVPESVSQIDMMTENIKGTCECILLEKERVGKGIDDMERIKDSFENRCIQTCANIKSELDRLPKLSRITLDNEVISMIGLSVPYVKEEFYKERMSAYINDTVAFCESFKTDEERITYIRGRLSWKKLFSVIVTDMNSIKLNLYKRERIKEQSRYLRYEEAVGSTGQSQGIYIQFLVAVINYISNINAAGKEVSSIGKVVFIDNPFGAAKDIYIWEPIFKLLKTNHVQLIVPARGATPAITGRFDVNYVLGQKMVNGRQQTVVVDYRSQVQNEEMEYTRLEYTQESLF